MPPKTSHKPKVAKKEVSSQGEVVFHNQKDRDAKAASKAVVNLLELIEEGELKLHDDRDDYVARIKSLRLNYTDKKLDIADLSLVLAAEDRKIGKIVTIDRKDFGFLTYKKLGKSAEQLAFTIILPEM